MNSATPVVDHPNRHGVPEERPRTAPASALTILRTKITPPRIARGDLFVERPRLTAKVERGVAAGLLLVSAPAGYGKSSAVLDALGENLTAGGLAWLSLDERDNDPDRFVTYLLAALLSDHEANIGRGSVEDRVEALLNHFARESAPTVLVIDDYHLITHSAIHQHLEYMIDFLPAQLRIVLTTRFDPPLPLARWRSRARMVEIRTEDLRFTPAETSALLDRNGLPSPGEDVLKQIQDRTDGWVFALQSVSSLLRKAEPGSTTGLIANFSGNQRDIADFLVDEILRSLSEADRDFLLKTAVLRRLTGAVCDAVTGESDGQQRLQTLELAGLPIIPLDDHRGAWRYHHLLSEMLLEQARQRLGDEGLRALHLAASQVFETRDEFDDAIHHAVQAAAWSRALELMERVGFDLVTFGNTMTAREWLQTFPDAFMRANPDLSYWLAQSLSSTCQPAAARRYLDQAAAGFVDQGRTEDIARIHIARSWCDFLEGLGPGGVDSARTALRLASEPELDEARLVLAVALSRNGDLHEAARVFDDMAEVPALPRVIRVERARLLMQQGALDEAARQIEAAIANDNLTDLVRRGQLWLAEIKLLQDDRESAARHLELAKSAARQLDARAVLPSLEVVEARLAWAQGQHERAYDVLEQAIAQAVGLGHPATALQSEAIRAGFWLEQGKSDEVGGWLERIRDRIAPCAHEIRQAFDLVDLRYLIRIGDDRAPAKLDTLLAAAERSERILDQARLFLWRAQLWQQRFRPDRAETALRAGLALLDLGRAARPALDDGLDLAAPLAAVAASGDHLSLVSAITAARGDGRTAGATASSQLNPLSARETEVLRLVSIGLSNKEIADQLYISVPTVKRHLSTVFEKLAVVSRTQAVSSGRALGVI